MTTVLRIDAGTFRAELYYRLSGVEILLPPLRERKADLEPLVRCFVERQAARLERSAPSLASARERSSR